MPSHPLPLEKPPMEEDAQATVDDHVDTIPAGLRSSDTPLRSATSRRKGTGYLKLIIAALAVLIVVSSLQQQSRRAADKRDPAKDVAAQRSGR